MPAAVLALRDDALERAVLERVVLDVHRQALARRGSRLGPLGTAQLLQHAVELEAEVVVQPRRVVLLDDEARRRRARPARPPRARACARSRASSGTRRAPREERMASGPCRVPWLTMTRARARVDSSSLLLQLHLLERRRPRIRIDHHQRGVLDARPDAARPDVVVDRREPRRARAGSAGSGAASPRASSGRSRAPAACRASSTSG